MLFCNLQPIMDKLTQGSSKISCYWAFGVEFEFYSTDKLEYNFADICKIANKHDIEIAGTEEEDGEGQYEFQTQPTTNYQKLCNFIAEVQASASTLKINTHPKPFPDQPASGMHLHIALYNQDDDMNLFFDPKKPNKLSNIALHAIGGCTKKYLNNFACFVNSDANFARFARSHDSTYKNSPSTVSWGINNRTCMIRIPRMLNYANIRIEHRLPAPNNNLSKCLETIVNNIVAGITQNIAPPLPTFGDSFSYERDVAPIFLPFSSAQLSN